VLPLGRGRQRTASCRIYPFLLVFLLLASRAQAQSRAGSFDIRGGSYEASGGVAVPGTTGVLFVDDSRGRHVFWMLFDKNGVQKSDATAVPLGVATTDLEDITTDGTFFYAVGSQSKGGNRTTIGLVRFRFDPISRQASDVQGIADLAGFIEREVPALAPGRRPWGTVLNIEGLVWDPVGQRLLFGLREPLGGDEALVVAVRLPSVRAGRFSFDNLRPGDVSLLRVATERLGVRGLGYDAAAKRVLAILGATSSVPLRERFELVSWDPAAGTSTTRIATLPAALKPEGVTRVTVDGRSHTLILCDTGRYLFLD